MNILKTMFFLIFALAGTLFLSIAYLEGESKYKIVQEGIETDGMVVEIYQKPRKTGEKPSTAQAPVVQFVTQDNRVVKYYSTTFLTPCPYQIGYQVKIKYLPENPQQAILDWKDGWILSIAFGIFGVVICLITYPHLLTRLIKFLLGLLYQ
jgi:Protein of unknown function (DUF3592)